MPQFTAESSKKHEGETTRIPSRISTSGTIISCTKKPSIFFVFCLFLHRWSHQQGRQRDKLLKDVFHCWEGGSFKLACLCRRNIFQIPAMTREEKQRKWGCGIPFYSSGRRMLCPGRRITNRMASKCPGFASHSDYQRLFFGFFFEGNQNKFACFTSIWPVTCANFMPQLGRTAPLNAPAAGWWCTVSWAGLSFWLVLDFCILN